MVIGSDRRSDPNGLVLMGEENCR